MDQAARSRDEEQLTSAAAPPPRARPAGPGGVDAGEQPGDPPDWMRTTDLLALFRETQAEALARAQAAAMWQARAEMLAQELQHTRVALKALEDQSQGRRWEPGQGQGERPGGWQAQRLSDGTAPPAAGAPEASPSAASARNGTTEDVAERLRAAIAGLSVPAEAPASREPWAPEPSAPPTPDSPPLDASPADRAAGTSGPSREAPGSPLDLPAAGRAATAGPVAGRPASGRSHRPASARRTRHAAPVLAAARTLFAALLVVGVLGLLGLVAPKAIGWEVLPVTGGSMEPTVPLGSLVAVQPIAGSDARVGDIITFTDRGRPNVLVTHRITAIEETEGRRILRTKGDANTVEDAWQLPADQQVGKVMYWIPWAGYLVAAVASPQAKLVLAGLILLLVLSWLLPTRRTPRRVATA